MTEHIEPSVVVVHAGTADSESNASIPPGPNEPPASNSKLDLTLHQMNEKMGTMADLIGKLCSSLDGREIQATGQSNCPPGTPTVDNERSKRRRKEPSVISSSESEESEDERMSLYASDEDLDRLVGEKDTANRSKRDLPSGEGSDLSKNAESILKELETAINDDENFGPKVTQNLADLALKRWGKKLPQEKLKALLAQHEVPENCAKMVVPKVNSEIWSQLNTRRKTHDLRLNNMQKNLLRATSAVLSMCDKVLSLNLDKDQQKRLMADGVDTIGLLSHVFTDISGVRKEQMKPALKTEFHSLCTKEPEEPSSLLFGDDLAKQIRDAKEATRIGVAVGHSKQERHKGQK